MYFYFPEQVREQYNTNLILEFEMRGGALLCYEKQVVEQEEIPFLALETLKFIIMHIYIIEGRLLTIVYLTWVSMRKALCLLGTRAPSLPWKMSARVSPPRPLMEGPRLGDRFEIRACDMVYELQHKFLEADVTLPIATAPTPPLPRITPFSF